MLIQVKFILDQLSCDLVFDQENSFLADRGAFHVVAETFMPPEKLVVGKPDVVVQLQMGSLVCVVELAATGVQDAVGNLVVLTGGSERHRSVEDCEWTSYCVDGHMNTLYKG